VEANVNVTREGESTRARVSLVARVTDADGKVRRVEALTDPLAYQSLLGRLDRAVYLEREGL
jgi:ketosteroid isomerase-like protein